VGFVAAIHTGQILTSPKFFRSEFDDPCQFLTPVRTVRVKKITSVL
jgi:hypothetical protein